MADAGLMITWGENVHGREVRGLEVFNETLEFWGRMQSEGSIESFEVALLQSSLPGLAGFIFVRGDDAALSAITSGDEHRRLIIRASMIVQDVRVTPALINEGLARGMAMYQEELAMTPAMSHN